LVRVVFEVVGFWVEGVGGVGVDEGIL